MLSMVKELANSPLLGDPGSDKHGKVVFFDVLGLFSVVYPERMAVIINSMVVLGCVASLYFGISSKKQNLGMELSALPIISDFFPTCNTEKPSVGMVMMAVVVTALSWLAAIIVNALTALLLDLTGHSMSWFTHTPLLLALYVVPALLAMAETHSFWLKNVSIISVLSYK